MSPVIQRLIHHIQFAGAFRRAIAMQCSGNYVDNYCAHIQTAAAAAEAFYTLAPICACVIRLSAGGLRFAARAASPPEQSNSIRHANVGGR